MAPHTRIALLVLAIALTCTMTATAAPPTAASAGVGGEVANARQPERVTTAAPRSGPLEGSLVVIDPGHNPGNRLHPQRIARRVDAGTLTKACDTVGTSTNGGYPEWRHNLRVARRLAKLLVARGARVVLTHDGKRPRWGPCISGRARLANRLEADVAVSIHADGHLGPGRGFHIIHPASVPGLTDDIAGSSRQLALRMRKAFRKTTGLPVSSYAGRRGLHQRDDIGGLNLSDVPKVLIETGNMRNAIDARLLTSGRFQWREARGIADGLTAFLQRSRPAAR